MPISNKKTYLKTGIVSEDRSAYRKEYDKQTIYQLSVKLHKTYDKKIIDFIESKKSEPGGKQGFIKQILKNEMEKEGKDNG